MYKATNHSKKRASQRLGVSYKSERNQLFQNAMKYGHPPADFAGQFRSYLDNKTNNKKKIQVKVYDDTIYVYKNKTIITVFPVPQMYLPIDNYYSSFIKNNPNLDKLYEIVDKQDVLLELVVRDNKEYVYGLYICDEFKNFGRGKTENDAKNNAIKQYLNTVKQGGS